MSAALLTAPLTPNVILPYYANLIANADTGGAIQTALDFAPSLSRVTGRNVSLKLEARQPDAFSFKVRGAANKMAALTSEERARGVITASAGNHAQGVAKAAAALSIAATIVMPKTTPASKIDAVKRLNPDARVILHGDAFPEALQEALRLQKERGLTFVHPYDDPLVIAGQGTIAREIFEQHAQRQDPPPVEAIFVPVGGGGLIAGIAAYTKFHHPNVKIIGVEPTDSDCLAQALASGERVMLKQVGLFADGVAVAQIGAEPFRVARAYVDDVIRVDYDQICAAAADIFADTRVFPEPAGALATAGLKLYAKSRVHAGGSLVAVVSGANVDPPRMIHMLERTLAAQHREILLTVKIPEKAGSLKELCAHLGGRNITEFNYRQTDDKNAHILIGIGTQNYHADGPVLLKQLADADYNAEDVSNNDLVREHLRHMVGGLPHRPIDEVLYSFEFSERPGALMQFLNAMPCKCDITLFHYRSIGAARGRVLMGFDAPPALREALQSFAKTGGYSGVNETENPAYKALLRHAVCVCT